MYEEDVDVFLAHYGVKGMKWGVRRSQAQLDRAAGRDGSSSDSSSNTSTGSKSRINKKKVALGVGVVAATAAVTIGAVALNQHRKSSGQAAVLSQLQKIGGQSAFDVVKNVSVTQPKSKPKPKSATAKQLASAKSKLKASTPSQRKAAKEEAAKAQIKAFAKKSMWEIAAENPPPKKSSKSSYSKRAAKADTKLYGAKGSARIEKRINRGHSLSSARQREAVRKYGGTAMRVAVNVGTAKAQENVRGRIRRR